MHSDVETAMEIRPYHMLIFFVFSVVFLHSQKKCYNDLDDIMMMRIFNMGFLTNIV